MYNNSVQAPTIFLVLQLLFLCRNLTVYDYEATSNTTTDGKVLSMHVNKIYKKILQ